jgi:hypothetical protein
MQAPASWRRFFLSVWTLLTAVACSAPAPAVRVPAPNAPARAKITPWARFAEVSAWPTVTEAPFPSQGHQAELPSARVRASPEAREAYAALVQDSVLPEGSVLALFHESADGVTRGAVYVMQKTGGSWQYLLLDAVGREGSGAIPGRCAGCHADAPADHLFGLPRSRSAPALTTTPE